MLLFVEKNIFTTSKTKYIINMLIQKYNYEQTQRTTKAKSSQIIQNKTKY